MSDQSPPPVSDATPAPQPAEKSRLTTTSLILGIISVPPFLALVLHLALEDAGAIIGVVLAMIGMPAAFILAIVALIRIRKSRGQLTGRGQAIAGLIVGVISFSLYLAMILPAVAGAREKDRRFRCMNNLKQIGVAISVYADAHDGNIPRSFDDLRPYATNLDKLLICPSAKDRSHPSYQIVFGGEKWERWNTNDNAIDVIVVTESTNDHSSGYSALYNDGHVAGVFTEGR